MEAIINKTYLKIIYILFQGVLLGLSCEAQNRIKKTDYEYDLVSGNVKQVTYQANRPEVFVQQYKYDADNRITEVRSSSDGVIFSRDAAYSYYQHGPLSRTVLGDNSVQGLDHVYTIQGWLKAVNSNVLDPSKDPGKDGQAGSKIARDVVGYSLGYYHNDYASIGGSMQFLSTITATDLDAGNAGLFNGNIRHMITSLTDNTGTQLDVQGNVYRYDQLNRIKQAELFVLNKATNSFSGVAASTKYKENFSYDANGNIINLTRNGNAATRLMDQLTYKYAEEGGKKANNRLLHVKDDALTATYANDINDQGTYAPNDPSTWNYRYDAIGNLKYDRQSGIEEISWNAGGKIKSIHGVADSARSDIEFKYDALGHRIAKIVKPFGHLTDPSFWIYTYYVLDAKGNTLAIYEKKTQNGEEKILLKEQYVYGSKRLSGIQRDLDVTGPYLPMPRDTYTFERILGKKQYELSNHLGNVLAVISDKRTAHLTPGGAPDYYLAQVSSATDYYAFGSPMPGRDFNSTNYRYGFNGMEKDNEVKGNSNSLDFGARIYDPRLGRWLSLDPAAADFAGWSSYNAFLDNPILFVDPDGKQPEKPTTFFGALVKKAQQYPRTWTLVQGLIRGSNSELENGTGKLNGSGAPSSNPFEEERKRNIESENKEVRKNKSAMGDGPDPKPNGPGNSTHPNGLGDMAEVKPNTPPNGTGHSINGHRQRKVRKGGGAAAIAAVILGVPDLYRSGDIHEYISGLNPIPNAKAHMGDGEYEDFSWEGLKTDFIISFWDSDYKPQPLPEESEQKMDPEPTPSTQDEDCKCSNPRE